MLYTWVLMCPPQVSPNLTAWIHCNTQFLIRQTNQLEFTFIAKLKEKNYMSSSPVTVALKLKFNSFSNKLPKETSTSRWKILIEMVLPMPELTWLAQLNLSVMLKSYSVIKTLILIQARTHFVTELRWFLNLKCLQQLLCWFIRKSPLHHLS